MHQGIATHLELAPDAEHLYVTVFRKDTVSFRCELFVNTNFLFTYNSCVQKHVYTHTGLDGCVMCLCVNTQEIFILGSSQIMYFKSTTIRVLEVKP